jgi:hypothetical protein
MYIKENDRWEYARMEDLTALFEFPHKNEDETITTTTTTQPVAQVFEAVKCRLVQCSSSV